MERIPPGNNKKKKEKKDFRAYLTGKCENPGLDFRHRVVV